MQFEDESGLPKLNGVSEIESNGRFHEFRMDNASQSQATLEQLIQQRQVSHFEIIKPSLHDIFVRIARPEAED